MPVLALLAVLFVSAGIALASEPGTDTSGSGGTDATPTPAATPDPEGGSPERVALPSPGSRLPARPGVLARRFAASSDALRRAIDRWRRDGDPARGLPPRDVALLALDEQRIGLALVRAGRRLDRVLAALPKRLRPRLRADVLAKRELAAIHSVVVQRPRIRTARPQPADRLMSHYRRAQRRFGVGWPLLAAVNMVESAFGRMRNESVSGAQGPMQFMPATWAAYGLGGDVQDPRDAILGAANYLHANGAPGDERRALYHYNPSRLYVSAVSRYARRIRADPRAFYAFYARQVFLRGRDGYRRVTSHGL